MFKILRRNPSLILENIKNILYNIRVLLYIKWQTTIKLKIEGNNLNGKDRKNNKRI